MTNAIRLIFLSVSVLFVVKCDDSQTKSQVKTQVKTLASETNLPSDIYKLRRFKHARETYLIPFPCHFQKKIKGDEDLSKGLVFQSSEY